jgi:hypothetical protein
MELGEARDLVEEIKLYFDDVRINVRDNATCVVYVYIPDGLFRIFKSFEEWIRYREKIEEEEN